MVFFLPGFLQQSGNQDGSIFNSVYFNILYMITVIPQILLLLYIISLKGPGAFSRYGITAMSSADIGKALLYYAGIMAILAGLYILMDLAAGILPFLDRNNIQTITWKINSPSILPLVFFTALITGYSEELFFRSYLLTEIMDYTGSRTVPVLAVSLLFSTGHIYQGIGGLISSFVIGIYFSNLFLKQRKIHSIAIGHALYNFSVLVTSIFLS